MTDRLAEIQIRSHNGVPNQKVVLDITPYSQCHSFFVSPLSAENNMKKKKSEN